MNSTSTPVCKENTWWNLAPTRLTLRDCNGFETNAVMSSTTFSSPKPELNPVVTFSRCAQYSSGWKASSSLIAWGTFSRFGKCVSCPMFRCVVQTRKAWLWMNSLHLSCGTDVFSGVQRCMHSVWKLNLSKNPRSSSRASSDNSLCSSFLGDRKVFISGSKSTNPCSTLSQLGHWTLAWRIR